MMGSMQVSTYQRMNRMFVINNNFTRSNRRTAIIAGINATLKEVNSTAPIIRNLCGASKMLMVPTIPPDMLNKYILIEYKFNPPASSRGVGKYINSKIKE